MKIVICKCCKHEREVFTGSELTSHRKGAKLSLKEASKLLGVSVSFINDCEHNRRNASSEMTEFWKMYELRKMVFKA